MSDLGEKAGRTKVRGNAKRKTPAEATAAPTAVELYNLADDLGEQNNLAAEEPDRVAAMRLRLDVLLKDAVTPGDKGSSADATEPTP